MYKAILVPLDGSSVAESILPYVKGLSRLTNVEIYILKVIEPTTEEIKKYATGDFASRISIEVKSESKKYFAKILDYLKLSNVKVTSNLLEGIPAVEIISEANKNPDTLIAMSTHGRSGIGRWLIGSVADKVVRESTVPLLLVRPQKRSPIGTEPVLKKVIVPLDESRFSEQVLPHVIYLAGALNLQVILTRVTPTVMDYARWNTDDGAQWPAADMAGIARNVDEGATKYMNDLSQKLKQHKITNVEQMLLQILLGCC